MLSKLGKTSFDYVVVGGGSAGCVLANRLSASGDKTVALLEAGPKDDASIIHTPSLLGLAVGQNRVINWCYESIPQKHMNNRKSFCPRGKTLGGSSSINAMVYIRGQPEDYDEWNIPGWSWKDMLPHFKETEKQLSMDSVEQEYHGTDGELCVSNLKYTNPLSHIFLDAVKQEGEVGNKDFNGKSQEGFGFYQVTQTNGKRCSAAKAFLSPDVVKRNNLTIFTNTQATRLLFDEPAKRVRGVQVVDTRFVNSTSNQSQIESKATTLEAGEVILCGGTINTPQLLLLSGIGPSEQLARLGIEQLHHLPGVGKNLLDHIDVVSAHREKTKLSYATTASWDSMKGLCSQIWDFATKSAGPMTSNLAEVGGFIRSSPDVVRPDIQFHFVPALFEDHARKLIFDYGYSLHACVLRPKSVGELQLVSSNPLHAPILDPNFLSAPEDVQTLLFALKKSIQYFRASAFLENYRDSLHPPDDLQTDEALIEWIRTRADTVYHPVGTCKMGTDDLSVVDPSLCVHGIQNLRVADGSIMPYIVSGNTNAPCIAIGSKAASLILSPTSQ